MCMSWQQELTIASHLVKSITDCGMTEYYDTIEDYYKSKPTDTDDLHVCLILETGMTVVLDSQCRLVMTEQFYIIERLSASLES
jgi:hypothetical protein